MVHIERKFIEAQKILIQELQDTSKPDIPEFQKAYAEIEKCIECEKYRYYGKTCNGVCIKEEEED